MELMMRIKDELSGSRAKSYVAGLTGFHRIQGTPMMLSAAEHVRAALGDVGVGDVMIEQFPADGRCRYWTYTSVMGWDVRSAELRLIEPHKELLVRFSDNPQSLHTYSRGTSKSGTTADLIDVGKGVSRDDYAGKRVKGKMVLATGQARLVHEEAVVKRGAAGVMTDSLAYEFPGVRESVDIPDAHSYQGIWPDAKTARKVKFGFSLSKRQGDSLRKHLAAGESVRLNARVDADLSPSVYSVVNAAIVGSSRPEEEILLLAHLCHPQPSANDNASGSGLLMEIARTISELIKSGKIGAPKRTIRFLWVPETVGTVAFLSRHPELHERIVAGINLDMVGEDQTVCGSSLCLDCTPDSLPSFLNDLVFSMVARSVAEYNKMARLGIAGNYRYERTAFSGGSDHAELNEATVGVPCVGLTQWPDRFYHTSMDTIDKVSEDSLQRVGLAVAASALILADADEDTIHSIASLTSSEGMKRISDAVARASQDLFDLRGKPRKARDSAIQHTMKLKHIVERERRAVRSVVRLDAVAGADAFVKQQEKAVAEHGLAEMSRLESIVEGTCRRKTSTQASDSKEEGQAEARAVRVVPKRLFKGTIDTDLMRAELGEKRYQWYKDIDKKDSLFPKKMYEIVNLMDGKRNVHEMTVFVSAEYGPTAHKDVLRFVDDLKRMNLVSL